MQKERKIWIDWAKAIGIVIVVFCHIPQDASFFRTFCCFLQMPLFFFISGYLHKNQAGLKTTFLKYLYAIIIPYFILQALNYPYWLFKYINENGEFTSVVDCVVSPFVDCFIGNPIAGPTWYVCSILLLKLFTVVVSKFRYANHVYLLVVVSAVIAGFCINHYPLDHQINFTILSTINFLPFYFAGYLAKCNNRMSSVGWPVGGIAFAVCLSLILLEGYVQFPDRLLFYLVGSFSVVAFLAVVQRIPKTFKVVEITSRGTILILGVHWMFIGTLNFVLEKFLNIEEIHYSPIVAWGIAILICAILQLFILFCMRYFKIILGGR